MEVFRSSKKEAVNEREHRFRQAVIPHLDAAYNLARWLSGNDHDAEDVTQEALVRAWRYFDGVRGDQPRAWLLAIVRNACFAWLRANRPAEISGSFDDPVRDDLHALPATGHGPEALAIESLDRRVLNEAIAALPTPFRETIILRELEGLSYREIARIIDAPIGTVMSRLARARRLLIQSLQVIRASAESGVRR
jgi:RNA polymerase sigma-70 factor, ECF subfamily